jgi:L-threonylcarbamoyladenylate synthase
MKNISRAIKVLKRGGIILYPTEGVWGLGCDPFNEIAVRRLLRIKRRSIAKGLILVAADWHQIKSLVKVDLLTCDAIKSRDEQPITWVFPATKKVPPSITGKFHSSIAIRITSHQLVKNICQEFGAPLVSTSANLSGDKPVKYLKHITQNIIDRVDYILPGSVGALNRPTQICDVVTGKIIRK